MAFFKDIFDIEPTPVGCVETLPDTDGNGVEIEGTGGRHDFFFFVKAADVPKFALKRLRFGMRWWDTSTAERASTRSNSFARTRIALWRIGDCCL